MRKIVLAGGSGNIGKLLAKSFLRKGDQVFVLTRGDRRSDEDKLSFVKWDGEHVGDWRGILDGADVLINLSGESIQKRLTEKNKILLEQSRVKPTKVLGEALALLSHPPKLWINFSGISKFGGVDGIHTEDSTASGNGFLAALTKKWEAVFWEAHVPKTAKTVLRLSPVLQVSDGMFAELYPLVKLRLGGTVGDGNQCISWIHERDLIDVIHWIVEHEDRSEIYHACSPNPTTNKEFMRLFREEAGVSFGLPLSVPLAKFGAFVKQVDDSLLLDSVSVVSQRLSTQGFRFEFGTLRDAFRELISRRRQK